MFTPDLTGLVAEYLFDGNLDGGVVKNTAGTQVAAPDGIVVAKRNPLELSGDVPFGFRGRSLNFDVLRKIAEADATAAHSQFVEVKGFDDLSELTVEVWVKPDYLSECSYPDQKIGFGACPQMLCKGCSWYLFLSTMQTDRNLIFTHIPNKVTQGLPRPQGRQPPQCGQAGDTSGNPCKPLTIRRGSGGSVSRHPVPGGVWSHLAVTFRKLRSHPNRDDLFEFQIYINGIPDRVTRVRDACGNSYLFPLRTFNPIFASGKEWPLRIGTFREEKPKLDYQYSGKLCGIRIYDRALKRSQIAADILFDTTPSGG